jgi:hypothetical protein
VFLKAGVENQNDTILIQNTLNYEISKLLRGSFYKSQPMNKVMGLLEDHQVPQDVKEDSVIRFLRSHWSLLSFFFTSDQYSDKLNQTPSHLYIKVKEMKDEKEKERIENIKRLIEPIYSSRPEGTIYFARTPGNYTH